jgi:hypothetical protein
MLPSEAALHDSPCCNRRLETLPLGSLEIFHYRCVECRLLFVWDGHTFIPCQVPDEHLASSRTGVPLHLCRDIGTATTENEGRGHDRR